MKDKCKRCGGSGIEPDNKEIGAYYKKKREKAKLQANHAAKELEITPQYLHDLENGRRGWSPELRIKYLKVLARHE